MEKRLLKLYQRGFLMLILVFLTACTSKQTYLYSDLSKDMALTEPEREYIDNALIEQASLPPDRLSYVFSSCQSLRSPYVNSVILAKASSLILPYKAADAPDKRRRSNYDVDEEMENLVRYQSRLNLIKSNDIKRLEATEYAESELDIAKREARDIFKLDYKAQQVGNMFPLDVESTLFEYYELTEQWLNNAVQEVDKAPNQKMIFQRLVDLGEKLDSGYMKMSSRCYLPWQPVNTLQEAKLYKFPEKRAEWVARVEKATYQLKSSINRKMVEIFQSEESGLIAELRNFDTIGDGQSRFSKYSLPADYFSQFLSQSKVKEIYESKRQLVLQRDRELKRVAELRKQLAKKRAEIYLATLQLSGSHDGWGIAAGSTKQNKILLHSSEQDNELIQISMSCQYYQETVPVVALRFTVVYQDKRNDPIEWVASHSRTENLSTVELDIQSENNNSLRYYGVLDTNGDSRTVNTFQLYVMQQADIRRLKADRSNAFAALVSAFISTRKFIQRDLSWNRKHITYGQIGSDGELRISAKYSASGRYKTWKSPDFREKLNLYKNYCI
ncbi:MAG: hypothetical protein ABJN96_16510 [Marinomonas sp.]